MIPDYACAYGASEETMRVLTDAYGDAITTMDRLGRTPLHFAFSTAGRKAAPSSVRLLLSLRKDIVNSSHGSQLPLRVLADYATSLRGKDTGPQKESVNKCLEHLLSFNPDPTADFFTALQSLPDWLRERAVVMPSVQLLLNEKIAQRFPTGVLLADAIIQIIAIVFSFYTFPNAVNYLFCHDEDGLIGYDNDGNVLANGTVPDSCYEPCKDSPEETCPISAVTWGWVVPLYLAGLYFLIRTLIQILSLLALGAFRVWFFDATNWLDVLYVFTLFYWATKMGLLGVKNEKGDFDYDYEAKEKFRTGIALSTLVLWTKLLAFLRNTYIDFAVFLGGLFYVVRRLVAFLLCLLVVLVAFSTMWVTIYQDTDRCSDPDSHLEDQDQFVSDLQCETNQIDEYCNQWSAFLNVFTMLLGTPLLFFLLFWCFLNKFCLTLFLPIVLPEGEVDDTQFQDSTFATVLFAVFMFLVVILLANVLIAIVTDSYKVIQDQVQFSLLKLYLFCVVLYH